MIWPFTKRRDVIVPDRMSDIFADECRVIERQVIALAIKFKLVTAADDKTVKLKVYGEIDEPWREVVLMTDWRTLIEAVSDQWSGVTEVAAGTNSLIDERVHPIKLHAEFWNGIRDLHLRIVGSVSGDALATVKSRIFRAMTIGFDEKFAKDMSILIDDQYPDLWVVVMISILCRNSTLDYN
jgi:hypothetical protein